MNKQKKHGFTLIELLVTIGIIIIIAAIALPTISVFMNAGADASAYNLISAQLTAARALAVESGTYAGVHFQLNDGDSSVTFMKLKQYSAIVEYSAPAKQDSTGTDVLQNFWLADGYQPQKMPGTMAVGELSDDFTNGNDYDGLSGGSANAQKNAFKDFCSFTIVFSSEGSVVVNVPNGATNTIDFANAGAFANVTSGPYAKSALWIHDDNISNSNTIDDNYVDYVDGENGVSALTLFDLSELAPRDGAQRELYLNDSGQFLPVNVHTGQLYLRK